MHVEFSEALQPALEKESTRLVIQAKYVPENVILDGYLKRGYGNAYDFDQKDHLEPQFA